MNYLNNLISDEIKLALLGITLAGLYSVVLIKGLQSVDYVSSINVPKKETITVTFPNSPTSYIPISRYYTR